MTDTPDCPTTVVMHEEAAEIVKAAWDGLRLMDTLRRIADMDPNGVRADDLGRAARIARDAIARVGKRTVPCPGCDGHECDEGCQYPGVIPTAGQAPLGE